MSNHIANIYKSDRTSFLRTLGSYLVMLLCVFVAFRSPLAELTTSAIKIIPDVLILSFFVFYSVSIGFRYKFKVYDFLFLGFLVVGFVSTVIVNRAGSYGGLYNFLFQVRSISVYYLLIFTLRNLKLGKKEFCRIIAVMQYVCYALLALGIIEKIFNKEYLFSQSVASGIIYADNFTRVYSMFFNPNTYGAFLAITLLASVAKQLYFGQKNPLIAYIALCISLLLSMSRSAILIMIPILLLCLLLAWRKKMVSGGSANAFSAKAFFKGIFSKKSNTNCFSWKNTLASVLVILVISIGVYWLTLAANSAYTQACASAGSVDEIKDNASQMDTWDRFQEMGSDSIIEQSNANGRFFAINTGLKVFSDHPVFGTGFGTYGSAASLHAEPEIYKQYDIPFPFYADNQYICVFAETGIVGTLVFCTFLLSILWVYRKNSFKMLLCITVGWLGLFYNVFEVQAITVAFWSLLAFDDASFSPIGFSLKQQKQQSMDMERTKK